MMNLNSAYILRGFEENNPSEIERMNLMYYHPEVMKAKGYWKRGASVIEDHELQESDQSMFNTLSTITSGYNDVAYAVADLTNKLVGWIWFYNDKSHSLPKMIIKKMGISLGNSRIYQVSYEKLMSDGWSSDILSKIVHTNLNQLKTPRKGVIVEGLRLALEKISAEFRSLYPESHKLVIYGYVNPRNIASRIVLERNGFVKHSRQYKYDGVLNHVWVKIL